jgi:hypothetical protein
VGVHRRDGGAAGGRAGGALAATVPRLVGLLERSALLAAVERPDFRVLLLAGQGPSAALDEALTRASIVDKTIAGWVREVQG